jgi:hypothetical protein
MACAPIEAPPQTLAAAVERAHCWSDHALAQPGAAALDGVWWLSTHLAAVTRVVYPVAHRLLPDARDEVLAQRRRTADLTRQLWLVEHGASGDARTRVSPALVAALVRGVREHAAADAALIDRLTYALAAESLSALQQRYAAAVRHAPSRPHPLVARSKLVASASYRALAVVDAARDTFDNRHIPRQIGL